MSEEIETTWKPCQDAIDACPTCKADPGLVTNPPPARPWNPSHSGRLLFISEAPPENGGFWEVDSEDDLRATLLGLLGLAGLTVSTHMNGRESLNAFLAGNFFLVQAVKWPIAKSTTGKRRSFNHLGSAVQPRLIEHSVSSHLIRETEIIRPSGIAMGTAAWHACQRLSPKPLTLPEGGVEKFYGNKYLLELPYGTIPLHLTFLPVDQNMRDP